MSKNKYGLIYCYTYKPTGEKYIGQTINFAKRQKEHLNEYRTNLKFHNLLRKHYEDFLIEILESNIEIINLNDREQYYIALFDTYNNGFNLTKGGDGGFTNCNKYWYNHPEEMKKHIAKIQPLATQAAQEWRKKNPELEQERLEQLHAKSNQWRKENPQEFMKNLKKAQLAAKKWREENPEKFIEAQKKAVKAVSKRVLLINTGEEFESASEASRKYGICASNISACCRGDRKSAGKNKEGKKLVWKYI